MNLRGGDFNYEYAEGLSKGCENHSRVDASVKSPVDLGLYRLFHRR